MNPGAIYLIRFCSTFLVCGLDLIQLGVSVASDTSCIAMKILAGG